MKKVLVSLTLALALVMAMIIPVSAATQTGATVTVSSYINFTVTDNGTAGLNFGTLNPGTTNNAESAQGGSGAVTLTVTAETNQNTNIQTKGDNFSITRTNGTATGGSATTLVDTGATFAEGVNVDIGDIIINRTDGSTGTVTAVTSSTTLTASGGFSGGADNTPANLDLYSVRAASPASTIEIANATWHTSNVAGSATVMTTSYATITASTAGTAKVQDAWHWLSVPNGQAPGTYTGIFYYQAVAQ